MIHEFYGSAPTLSETKQEVRRFFYQYLKDRNLDQISIPEFADQVDEMVGIIMPDDHLLERWVEHDPFLVEENETSFGAIHRILSETASDVFSDRFTGLYRIVVGVRPAQGVRLRDIVTPSDEPDYHTDL